MRSLLRTALSVLVTTPSSIQRHGALSLCIVAFGDRSCGVQSCTGTGAALLPTSIASISGLFSSISTLRKYPAAIQIMT